MPADKFLPAIGHAVSGAVGTAISTTTTYPLDLVNTRLKVQRQLRKDGTLSPSEQYHGLLDAFSKIFQREGGLVAFYAGLGSDVAKSVADSFLFFLFYTWFRSRRSRANSRRLPAWEELSVGAAAGACARLFTTPISNVVTRKQTASLLTTTTTPSSSPKSSSPPPPPPPTPTFAQVLHELRAERGFTGLWAGYGATLVLTLNPSLTFSLQHVLQRMVNSGQGSAAEVFLVAALSKVVATALTYPFNIAKARAQVSTTTTAEKSADGEKEDKEVAGLSSKVKRLAGSTIFGSLVRIARTEGVSSLYDGLSGELLKAFFNHGTTMMTKDIVHGMIVKLYFFLLALLRRSRAGGETMAFNQISGKYGEIKDGVMRAAVVVSIMEWTQRRLILPK